MDFPVTSLQETRNPVVGCNGVGCAVRDKCWARAQAKRRQHACADCYAFKPHFHEERLHQPSALKKPARIGVSFMGDLFDAEVKREWRNKIVDEMLKARQHTFIVLTKQPQNIACLSVPNAIFGVTVNRASDLWRVTSLLEHTTDEQRRFISFEPLMEDLPQLQNFIGFEWIVIGAQTRPNIQPKKEWVESLITKANAGNVQVTLKNNLKVK